MRFLRLILALLFVLPLAVLGCKAKTEKPAEDTMMDTAEMMAPMTEAALKADATVIEPAQTVATETIPPTAAAPQIAEKPLTAVSQAALDKNKQIQTALKNAGFYNGAIDGKIGPRTKKAILDFQQANGLKVDGKVGPKTWAALEKHLIKQ
ncbi:MAG: peptidoglycan-binding protein [Candidatus Omnitrophica bacterium]|nr:peptidoglycan-binding protein [Candidatus Omnitrophota bacterium]